MASPRPPAHPSGGADGDGMGLAQGQAPGFWHGTAPQHPWVTRPALSSWVWGRVWGGGREGPVGGELIPPPPGGSSALAPPAAGEYFGGAPKSAWRGGQAEGGTWAGMGTGRVPARRDSGLTTPSTCAPGSWASSWGSGKHGRTPRTARRCPGPCRGQTGEGDTAQSWAPPQRGCPPRTLPLTPGAHCAPVLGPVPVVLRGVLVRQHLQVDGLGSPLDAPVLGGGRSRGSDQGGTLGPGTRWDPQGPGHPPGWPFWLLGVRAGVPWWCLLLWGLPEPTYEAWMGWASVGACLLLNGHTCFCRVS